MPTHTPPLQAAQFTPQNAPHMRRVLPGSTGRTSLSTSFSFHPNDTSISDVSLAGTPTRARAPVLSSAEQGNMGMSQMSPRIRSPLTRKSAAGPSGSTTLGLPGSEPRATRSRSRLSEVAGPDDEDAADGADDTWGMIDSMRNWRSDAYASHLYETAAFWGDKIYDLTSDPNDAFWLAQTYYHMQRYARAELLLTEPARIRPTPAFVGKGKGRELPMENGEEQEEEDLRPLASLLPCRYLAAKCMVQQGKFEDALELVGENDTFSEPNDANLPSPDDGVKIKSSLCFLRGQLHLRLSGQPRAKECFMAALILDVKNYEAFNELVTKQMMTSAEEWEFINNLNYRSQLEPEPAKFVRMMYLSKLRKDAHIAEITAVRREFSEVYGLADNCDVLVGLAEELFAAYKWEECYAVTSRVLKRVPGHTGALQLHLGCMHHVPRLHSSLFILAHELVQAEPEEAISWYAVGLWYYTGGRWAEARRYFARANLEDQRFAPAWVAYAHCFREEGEHDQAVAAYSTAARNFPGSHLPFLSMGTVYLQLSQGALADEHLLAAASLQPSDPLLLNELGVAAYNRDDYPSATDYFERAIAGASGMQGSTEAWSATHCNLGHALRWQGKYPEARAAYQSAIRLDPTNSTAYASQAMIAQFEGDVRTAIRLYHTALSFSPQDQVVTALLENALKEQVDTLDPTTLPGLPVAIASRDLDPFSVPKGNPSFGPLPVESDPATLDEAGDTSVPALRPRDRSLLGVDAASMSMSMSMSRRQIPEGDESSAMDIEED